MKQGFNAQFRAFFSEFPWAYKYVPNQNWISELPTVQRVDLDLIDKFPWTWEWSRKRHGWATSQWYYLIDKSGNELSEVKRFDVGRYRLFMGREIIAGETICESILKLRDIDKIGFILDVHDRYGHQDLGSPFKDEKRGMVITIHKVPKGRTFSKWMDELPLVATEKLQKNIAELDDV